MIFRYLIETDWIIHYLNGHPDIVNRLTPCAMRAVRWWATNAP
ncbi:MAG: hypothetical protein OJF50_005364 [Nitrospira sp.]|nr:hypothetical protein [Nitrospira sp.]